MGNRWYLIKMEVKKEAGLGEVSGIYTDIDVVAGHPRGEAEQIGGAG